MNRYYPRPLAAGLLLGVLLALPACARKTEGDTGGLNYGQTVRGKVTYKGEPVSYGVVLFYHPEKSYDEKNNQWAPVATATLSKTGTYESNNVPEGRLLVCIACDPELDELSLMMPRQMGGLPPDLSGKGSPPMAGGGPPQAGGGPPMAGGGPPQAGGGPPFAGGGPPMAGGGPPFAGGAPPQAGGGPPFAGGGPPMLPGGGQPNPAAKDMPEAQKKMLKEVHARYGIIGKSGIAVPIQVGEQTYNFELK